MMQLPAGMAALARHDNFILVRLTPSSTKLGRTEKLPIDWRTGRVVDAHDRSHWMPYYLAAPMPTMWGADYTLGWVLTPEAGLWCLDVDHCVVNGQWTDTAQRLFALLPGAAVEVSQSREGLHFWGSGRLPEHGKRCAALGLELYSELRYIALTGHVLQGSADTDLAEPMSQLVAACFPPAPAPAEVADAGPCAEWRGPADDAELIRRALASRGAGATFGSRATFADLWHADADALGRAYPDGSRAFDASSADAALAQHLAFWTGKDHARIDRLMRQSALVREKWDRADYVARTVGKACTQQGKVLQDAPAPATAQAAWDALHKLPADELAAAWVPRALALPQVEASKLVALMSVCTGAGKRELNAQLRDARKAIEAEHNAAAVAQRAAGKELIEHRPEDATAQAAVLEARIVATAAPGQYLQFAGQLARVAIKELPHSHMVDSPDSKAPTVPQIELIDRTAALAEIERVAVLFEPTRSGGQRPIRVPDRLVDVLVNKADHKAPNVSGLVLHPVVLHDGVILNTPGLHAGSGLFLHCDGDPLTRPYGHAEAVAALHRVTAALLEGFEFATPLDRVVALSALFTGVQRRVLDMAPGLAVVASVQSSGKTTLARRIHALLTGRDMPASTFPLGDGPEIQKQLLSALLSNPAMVCFDNVPDGYTFRSGVLAGAMTSSRIKQRILGASRDVDCPTNTLFVLTGNNLDFGQDEVSRWLVCRLAPSVARPEERTFKHPDVVAHAAGIRPAILRDVVGIVAGYLMNARGSIPVASRFPQWDDMVRQPLMWAGGADVAEGFRQNAEESDAVQSHRSLLHQLRAAFGAEQFAAHQVVAKVALTADLRAALERLGTKDASAARSVGHKLNQAVGRVAVLDGAGYSLLRIKDGAGPGTFGYRVAPAGL